MNRNILIGVVLVLLIAGGWWYFSQSNAPATAQLPVQQTTQNATQATSAQNPNASSAARKTYAQYGFNIQYPNNLQVDTTVHSSFQVISPFTSTQAQEILALGMWGKNHIKSGALYVHVSKDPIDVSSCSSAPQTAQNVETTKIQGVLFSSYVASSGSTSAYWYKALHAGSCYAIGYDIVSSDTTGWNQAQFNAAQADNNEISAVFTAVLQSFQFTK